MRLVILAVGRAKKTSVQALYEDYARRLRMPLVLREVEERRPSSGAERKRQEGALLRAALAEEEGALCVALDEKGEMFSSDELARRLGAWRDRGVRSLVFLIGGAEGLSDDLKAGADLVLSLGRLTWPHLLVRALLAEQLYRAESILTGHPYHRAG